MLGTEPGITRNTFLRGKRKKLFIICSLKTFKNAMKTPKIWEISFLLGSLQKNEDNSVFFQIPWLQ
jgi:hypothetical protein